MISPPIIFKLQNKKYIQRTLNVWPQIAPASDTRRFMKKMQSIPENQMLKFHSDTMISIRKLYNLDKPGEMDEAIDLLDDWIKKQNHFTKKDYSREYLERSIIFLKGSVERSKSHIEKLCTLRTILPVYFDKHDPKNDIQDLRRHVVHAVLPKLTQDNYRVYAAKVLRTDFNPKLALACHRYGALLCEYVKAHDYSNGFIGVADFRDMNLIELITAINLSESNKFITLLLQGYGMRVKGIHLLTPSRTVEILIKTFSKMFGPKVSKRVHVHATPETLYEHIPKEILPAEFGGYEKPIAELHGEWTDCLSLKENIEYSKEISQAVTNEAYRQTDTFNEMYMGMAGTFRNLNVD